MERKTIAVLMCTTCVYYECGTPDTSTSCFEAYESYEDALVSLEEEYNSSVNERIFKNEELIYTNIDNEDDNCRATVIYNDKYGNRNSDVFEIQVIDLVTK